MNSISVIELTCRPSVVSSFFRTLWNGWPTTYRMRTMSGAPKTQQCVLGCRGAEDRIEHYLVCKKVWAALEGRPPQGLGIHRSRQNITAMLLADASLADVERMAIATAGYAIFRTVHCMRNGPPTLRALPIMKLHLAEGLRGSKARGIIMQSFSSDFP